MRFSGRQADSKGDNNLCHSNERGREGESGGMEMSEIVSVVPKADTYHIVEAYTPTLKKDLAGKAVHKGKPELGHKERDEKG